MEIILYCKLQWKSHYYIIMYVMTEMTLECKSQPYSKNHIVILISIEISL